jgi:hypothetical protein
LSQLNRFTSFLLSRVSSISDSSKAYRSLVIYNIHGPSITLRSMKVAPVGPLLITTYVSIKCIQCWCHNQVITSIKNLVTWSLCVIGLLFSYMHVVGSGRRLLPRSRAPHRRPRRARLLQSETGPREVDLGKQATEICPMFSFVCSPSQNLRRPTFV